MVGKLKAAIAWKVEDPAKSGELTNSIDEESHLSGGPGIQLVKLNVPIGGKNIFGDNVRSTILNWYLGDVHVMAPDVLPNASGDGLRAGTAGESFIESLKVWYKSLEEQAEQKSARVSLVRKLKQGQEAAKALSDGKPLAEGRKQQELAKVAKAVELIEETGKKTKPTTAAEQRIRSALNETPVRDVRNDVRRTLKETGYLDQFASKPRPQHPTKEKTKAAKQAGKARKWSGSAYGLSADEFQAAVGQIIPRLKAIKLSNQQIEEVLEIIRELVSS
jgi:hypothetical protein